MALLNKLFFPLTHANNATTATATTPVAVGVSGGNSSGSGSGSSTLAHTSAALSFPTRVVAAGPALPPTVTPTAMAMSSASIASSSCGSKNRNNRSNNGVTHGVVIAGGDIKQTFKPPQLQHSQHSQQISATNYLTNFPFIGHGQVRVLLYREDDHKGRRLIFDSKALQKVPLKDGRPADVGVCPSDTQRKQSTNGKSNALNFIEVCADYGYKHNRPSSTDITSLGEMVFGSLAMSFRGTALKMHWLPEPARMLCSQVFLAPLSAATNSSAFSMQNLLASPRSSICSDQDGSDALSMNSVSMPFTIRVGQQLIATPPLDVPAQKGVAGSTQSAYSTPRLSSTYSNTTDSGYSGISRATGASDRWSRLFSTRSSIGSVASDQSEPLRKLSTDSSSDFSSSPLLREYASDGCMRRRISRNICTSLEREQSTIDSVGFASDSCFEERSSASRSSSSHHGGSEGGTIRLAPNYRRASYCANESRSNPEIGGRRDSAKAHGRRAKLGLAVCILLSESFEREMELFCSEHLPLLESMLNRLRARAEYAYINHHKFLQIMFEAWQQAQQWLNDLFTAPRIKTPVWLSITTSGSKHSKSIADRFVKELCWLLSIADTKDTNFFVSTILTGILTYHLGWVSTVAAFNQTQKSDANAAHAAIEQRAKLLRISQTHPYNALWAQLGDLYGAIGLPSKLARTIIHGTEKLNVEKLLNVLSYFIRCSEVRRTSRREDFNKELIDALVCENNNLRDVEQKPMKNTKDGGVSSLGLRRTKTCAQNLSEIKPKPQDMHSTLKRNEIPNVLAFRDSHFVQQELRIGNYLMDTGIEKKAKKETPIRLTITTPDNIEMNVVDDDESQHVDAAVEAIEVDAGEGIDDQEEETNAKPKQNKSKNFLWNIVPAKVKQGLSISEVVKIQEGVKLINRKLGEREASFPQDDPKSASKMPISRRHSMQISLSDLITQNSMGKNERMTWGIEPIKENICLEEQIHFENCQKQLGNVINMNVAERRSDQNDNVMFVLGDNEPLVNLKKSNEDVREHNEQPLCSMHQHQRNNHVAPQKLSVMKFNFEQYPQIATNYMKSKNIVMSDYQFLKNKPSKFEVLEDNLASTSLPSPFKQLVPATPAQSCVLCNSPARGYQTPSNATELEFESDDMHCHAHLLDKKYTNLRAVGSATSMDTIKPNVVEKSGSDAVEFISHHQGGKANHFLKLPLPGMKDLHLENEPAVEKLRAGFIPSLLLNICDHYVPDMVLQGTDLAPSQWESQLREDLTVATHADVLTAQCAENVAIVADMSKWEVRLLVSQPQHFQHAGEPSAPIGMSQLVCTMLETVQAMYIGGLSAYDCLAYLEAKLQEIYLQSEALAAFLLETDFCPMNVVTTALELNEHDVPLLFSIATINTPKIGRKYGISIR